MKRFRIKFSTVFSFVLATILGASLFWVSQQVQQLEREQREIAEVIASEDEGMRVLNAEWDYLNRPDRIEALAAKYLNTMTPVTPDNLLRDASAVPEPQIMQGEDDAPVLVSTVTEAVKKGKVKLVATESRPIRDDDAPAAVDFNNVLEQATGNE